MKYLLLLLPFLTLFNGCSHKNAYSYFEMNTQTQLFESNTQSMKIIGSRGLEGLLTVAYLNNIDSNISQDQEHFLVSLYMKDKNSSYSFKLNAESPISIKSLENKEKYNSFFESQSPWSKNTLITFKRSSDLNLTFYSSPSTSVLMSFSKEQ